MKVGDKVICIDDTNQLRGGLVKDKIYTIDDIDKDGDLRVIGLYWYNFRFRFRKIETDWVDELLESIIEEELVNVY